MKIEKSISELVKTNYVPVEESKEGLLRGGFGEISEGTKADGGYIAGLDNCQCGGNNCNCLNGCHSETGNNCDCPGKIAKNGNNCNCGVTSSTTTLPPPGISF